MIVLSLSAVHDFEPALSPSNYKLAFRSQQTSPHLLLLENGGRKRLPKINPSLTLIFCLDKQPPTPLNSILLYTCREPIALLKCCKLRSDIKRFAQKKREQNVVLFERGGDGWDCWKWFSFSDRQVAWKHSRHQHVVKLPFFLSQFNCALFHIQHLQSGE